MAQEGMDVGGCEIGDLGLDYDSRVECGDLSRGGDGLGNGLNGIALVK